jgi:hypothetical protein
MTISGAPKDFIEELQRELDRLPPALQAKACVFAGAFYQTHVRKGQQEGVVWHKVGSASMALVLKGGGVLVQAVSDKFATNNWPHPWMVGADRGPLNFRIKDPALIEAAVLQDVEIAHALYLGQLPLIPSSLTILATQETMPFLRVLDGRIVPLGYKLRVEQRDGISPRMHFMLDYKAAGVVSTMTSGTLTEARAASELDVLKAKVAARTNALAKHGEKLRGEREEAVKVRTLADALAERKEAALLRMGKKVAK